jgi:hypothetical protein
VRGEYIIRKPSLKRSSVIVSTIRISKVAVASETS